MEKLIFEFGNGGVLVNRDDFSTRVRLTQIKPPLGYIGTIKENDLDDKEELYSISFNRETILSMFDEINSLSGPAVLEFEKCILDFTNFKEESLKILVDAMKKVINYHSQLALAC